MASRLHDRAALSRTLTRALDTLADDAPPALQTLLPELRTLLGCEQVMAYGLSPALGRTRLDWCYALARDPAISERLARTINEAPGAWGLFDPTCPDPVQRNQPLSIAGLQRVTGRPPAPLWSEVARPALGVVDQLRVLVCEGPVILGWVGGFHDRPFTGADARALAAVVPALRRRLRLERLLGRASLQVAALDAALDQIPGAAFVVDRRGGVEHANAAGRRLLDADRAAVLADVAASAGAPSSAAPYAITSLETAGVTGLSLAVQQRPPPDLVDRARRAARRIGLTPRQAEVLALLAKGAANKTIAAALGCAPATVEIHVSAVLQRAQVDCRAALVAWFWTQ
jgi:DNA-binding CsgD family transcriptional regulator/PAS domain-containing protein